MKELHVKYGVSPFIEVSVRPNPQIPGRSSISISPSGLGLPAKSYYYGPQDDKVNDGSKLVFFLLRCAPTKPHFL